MKAEAENKNFENLNKAVDRGKIALKAEMAVKDRSKFEKQMQEIHIKENLEKIKKRQ
jgi:hypothetical protein